MKKLILIDGSGLIYRSFYAVPPFMRNPEGIQTNAVFGFANILFALLGKQKPDYMAIAFDKKGPTFRHKQFAEYKATRVKAPDELYAQIPIVKNLVDAFKIPAFEAEGFEADDILATIVEKLYEKQDIEVQIATGDFDIFQLITKNVSILYPINGFKDAQIFRASEAKEKYGIPPERIIDYKALCGDSSDNIPGVPGIGPKTAVQLLRAYGNIENVYKNIDVITPDGVRNKLVKNRDSAFLSKELVTLVRNVPVSFDLEACRTDRFDPKTITAFFDKLGFKAFRQRLAQLNSNVKVELGAGANAGVRQTSLFD